MRTIIKIIKGDITKQAVDAIVNAANSSLMGGGGVDGAIHRAGGPEILEACKKIVSEQGPCKTGEAVITTGGSLPARFVIHAVGPIWQGGKNNEEQLLADAYVNSLNLAVLNDIRTIAFPNISTGVYKFPKDKAARIALKTARAFIKTENIFEEILFVCFDDDNFQLYNHLLLVKNH
jgi:O-acetyl-ADP-ribose deacetylase (regulator of RNase III)